VAHIDAMFGVHLDLPLSLRHAPLLRSSPLCHVLCSGCAVACCSQTCGRPAHARTSGLATRSHSALNVSVSTRYCCPFDVLPLAGCVALAPLFVPLVLMFTATGVVLDPRSLQLTAATAATAAALRSLAYVVAAGLARQRATSENKKEGT
jgi:hypothetical protein